MLPLSLIVFATFVQDSVFGLPDPSVACYVEISDRKEVCYYYPEIGYQCEHCDPSVHDCQSGIDETRRTLRPCAVIGQCYVPVSGEFNEVCYYTPPFGYDCYFEYEEHITANLTHCDDLKANAAPEIEFIAPDIEGFEDIPKLIGYVSIVDLDADDAITDGEGYLMVTITVTNGEVSFQPSLMLEGEQKERAIEALDPSRHKKDGGINFQVSNGSWAGSIVFEARQSAMQNVMRALAFRSAQNFNTNKGTSRLNIIVNDQGNTGGDPESDQDQLFLRSAPVNDPPVVVMDPPLGSTNEDQMKPIPSLDFSDVDLDEVGLKPMSVHLQVTKGTLGWNTATTSSALNQQPKLSNGAKVLETLGSLAATNSFLRNLEYRPDPNQNDQTTTGIETLTITVNDGGNTGESTVYGSSKGIFEFPIRVNPVNDPPEVTIDKDTNGNQIQLRTVEDTPLLGLAVTVSDVDTSSNLIIDLSMGNGVLTIPDNVVTGPVITGSGTNNVVVSGVTLNQIATILSFIEYTPNLNFNGEDTLTVNLNDNVGGVANPKELKIHVIPANDEPTVYLSMADNSTPVSSWTVSQGRTLTLNGGGTGGAAADSDANAPAIMVADPDDADTTGVVKLQVLIVVFEGTLTLGTTSGLDMVVSANEDPEERILLFMGTVADVNNALATLSYTKEKDCYDGDRLIIAINDMGNIGDVEDPKTATLEVDIANVV